jgi:hypothetical protein
MLDFKYIVKGDHPVFRRIDRRCLSLKEAENVKDGPCRKKGTFSTK